MAAELPSSGEDSLPPRRIRSISDLVPEKVTVPTSIGTLFVRTKKHRELIRWSEEPDVERLGQIALHEMTNRTQDKSDVSPLAKADLDHLTAADRSALIVAIAALNNWGELAPDADAGALGQAIQAEISRLNEENKEKISAAHQRLQQSYAYLGGETLAKLSAQMAAISAMTSNPFDSATQAAMRNHKAMLDSIGGRETLATWQALQASTPPAVRAAEALEKSGLLDSSGHAKHLEIPGVQLPRIDALNIRRPEDTPLGKAALQSAENTREALERMESLLAMVGSLNQTIVQDLLPRWSNQIKEDQRSATEAFEQAGQSLRWTRWAVIASVILEHSAHLGGVSDSTTVF